MLERLDFWLAVLTLGLLAWAESRHIRRKLQPYMAASARALRPIAGLMRRAAYALTTGRPASPNRVADQRGNLHPAVRDDFPLPSAENTALHGGDPTVETGDIAPATPDEVQALARALRHNHTTPDKTKSGAIKAGWGLSRSGTDPRYKRASELYDLATKPEEPVSTFPELTAEKKRATLKASRTTKEA